jgi:hypothetical protein
MSPLDKELLKRLPRTFGVALNEQLHRWDLLFPAEQRAIQDQLVYLGKLPAPEFEELFRGIKALEAKMRLPAWEASSAGLSISDTSLLVRSPYYSQWRAEVEGAFTRINDGVEAARPRQPLNRLVVCVLPAGLPRATGTPWPRLATQGQTLRLQAPFGSIQGDFVRALARGAGPGSDPVERAWVFEAGSALSRGQSPEGLTALSFDGLAGVRKEFLRRLNLIKKNLRSADQAYEELRRLDLGPLLGPRLGRQPRLGGFIRDLFLSGNGSMLFANSFVQWGASEAMRRAQPRVVVCQFGIRNRLKPFSSVVLFEDQSRANPVPEQEDPAASLIDAQILGEYVYLTAARLPAYQGRTLGLFGVADGDSVLALGPEARPIAPEEGYSVAGLAGAVLDWMKGLAFSP